jgi:hypothetical protein
MPDRDRRLTLRAIDDLWAEHLARVADYRAGVQWVSWSGRDPHRAYLLTIHQWFDELEARLPEEIARRIESSDDPAGRGAVWTYLTTDQPFGNLTERLARGLRDWLAAYMGG